MLPISVPFHSVHLSEAIPFIHRDIQGMSPFVGRPVGPICSSAPKQGDVGRLPNTEALKAIIDSICVLQVDWRMFAPSAWDSRLVLDFGPGTTTHVSTHLQGFGVEVAHVARDYEQVICIDTLKSMSQDPFEVYMPDWVTGPCGQMYLQTKFTRVTGKPPVMVAGMTPTTSHGDFVAACMNAGYYCELAGG
jgi:fatty acid synthase subunit beta